LRNERQVTLGHDLARSRPLPPISVVKTVVGGSLAANLNLSLSLTRRQSFRQAIADLPAGLQKRDELLPRLGGNR